VPRDSQDTAGQSISGAPTVTEFGFHDSYEWTSVLGNSRRCEREIAGMVHGKFGQPAVGASHTGDCTADTVESVFTNGAVVSSPRPRCAAHTSAFDSDFYSGEPRKRR
jgi:hypothetical protein